MDHIGARSDRFDQPSQTRLQRLEQRSAASRPGLLQNGPRQAAVLRFHLDVARQHAVDAELGRVAAVYTCEQRLGEVVHRLGAVMVHEKLPDAAVAVPRRPAEILQTHLDFRPPAQQPGRHHGHDLRRDHHHHAVGQRLQFASPENERYARVVVGADDQVIEAGVFDQIERRGLRRDEAVRAGFKRAALDLLGLDYSAEPVASLDKQRTDAGSIQVVGGG